MRAIRYFFVQCWLAKFINGKLIQGLFPALAMAYFLTLDVWGSELRFVSDNINEHKFAFGILLSVTLLTQVFRFISDTVSSEGRESYTRSLEDFMALSGRVVEFKLNRFRKTAKNITPGGDTFKAITHPKDQITYIIDQSLAWMREYFGLLENQLSITIIQIEDSGKRQYFAFEEPRGWNRTKAKVVMSKESTAALAARTGEAVFFADKSRAEKSGDYYKSERDKTYKQGSIYCYPILVQVPNDTIGYIISITTYGKYLCVPNDQVAAEITKSIMREICRRIELELTLMSMRMYKFGGGK